MAAATTQEQIGKAFGTKAPAADTMPNANAQGADYRTWVYLALGVVAVLLLVRTLR